MYKILPILLFAYGLCGFTKYEPYSECNDNVGSLVFYLTSQSYIKLDAPITCEKARIELGCLFEIGDPISDERGHNRKRTIAEYCPKTCGVCEKESISFEELSKMIQALHLDILNENKLPKKIQQLSDDYVELLSDHLDESLITILNPDKFIIIVELSLGDATWYDSSFISINLIPPDEKIPHERLSIDSQIENFNYLSKRDSLFTSYNNNGLLFVARRPIFS